MGRQGVQEILVNNRAQLPDEGLGEFTKDVWQIVQDAIEHTCTATIDQGVPAALVE